MAQIYSLDTGPFRIIAEALEVTANSDPLDILIAEEESDQHEGACSFPQCYKPCRNCKRHISSQ